MIFRLFVKWVKRRKIIRVKLFRVLIVALMLNLFFGFAFYFSESGAQENLTISDSLWWAMVTMTTVGYGDFYAQTFVGRYIISYPCMLVGIGILGYFVSVIAESVLEKVSKKKRGMMDIDAENHVIICHVPSENKILEIVNELKGHAVYKESLFVVVADTIDRIPERLNSEGLRFVKGDPTQEEVLLRANIFDSAGVFVLSEKTDDPASDAKTIAICAILDLLERDSGKHIHVIAEIANPNNEKVLRRARVNGVISSHGVTDCLMVQEFLYPGINHIVRDIISNSKGSQFYIFDTSIKDVSFKQIQTKVLEYGDNIQVVGLVREDQTILNPDKSILVKSEDKLILLANSSEDFKKVENKMLKEKTMLATS